MPLTLESIRQTPPATADHLWHWVRAFTGIAIARSAVCRGHHAPFDAFASWWLDRPNLALLLGPRGGGKSFLSAIDTHLRSRFHRGHGTRILGGSRAQSQQIYDALSDVIRDGTGRLGGDADTIRSLLKTEAHYHNSSHVTILAASPTSVRGPHVQSLKLDEVDEIDPDLRESAMGMAMEKHGVKSTVVMTSTWHRVGGPMAGLIDRAESGAYPFHRFCMFEVLQRCPESRSGAHLEQCPACPLQPWCHDDHPSGLPRAKRSDGHYAIDSAIQKVQSVSRRAFEADFLCSGPRPDGLWFKDFDPTRQVAESAEFDPALPVHISIDSGVFTGAVLCQFRDRPGQAPLITVFADYLAEGVGAEANAKAILEVARVRCGIAPCLEFSTDPAGGARNPIGPTVIAEYERAGMRRIDRWPIGPVADSLALVESLLMAADGSVSLLIHPRCRDLVAALSCYRRAKRQGQWQDAPEDPQHPAEDLVDALRGAIKLKLPEGRRPERLLRRVPARSVL